MSGGGGNLFANLRSILWGTNQSLGAEGYNQVLWFLPCFFIAVILYKALTSKIYGRNKVYSGIGCVTCLVIGFFLSYYNTVIFNFGMPWGLNSAFVGVAFMLLGDSFYKIVECIDFNKYKIIIIAICIAMLTIVYFATDYVGYIVMATGVYQHRIIYLILAIVALIAITFISKMLETLPYIDFIGRNSIVILALHYTLFKITIPLMELLISHGIESFFIPFINGIITIILCIPFIIIINCFVPILNGKRG